jgi:hypothetical protein
MRAVVSRGGLLALLFLGCGSAATRAGHGGGSGAEAGAEGGGGEPGEPTIASCREEEAYAGVLPSLVPANLLCGALGDLTAEEGVILDVGHHGQIADVYVSRDRLLSSGWRDWVLWDASVRRILARGEVGGCQGYEDGVCDDPCQGRVEMAGDVLGVSSCSTIDLLSSRDAHRLAALPADASTWVNWGLATDGSYIWVDSFEGVVIKDVTGALLVSTDDDLPRRDLVFAAPDALRFVTLSSVGYQVRTISVATGMATSSEPLTGELEGWFSDGSRFLTSDGPIVRIYSRDGTREEHRLHLTFVGKLGGYGDFFWNFDARSGQLEIRKLSDPNEIAYRRVFEPSELQGGFRQGGNSIAALGARSLQVVNVQGSGVEETSLEVATSNSAVFGADAEGHWGIGDSSGLVHTSFAPERPLSCGGVLEVLGSSSGMSVVGTPAGVLLFELAPESRRYLGAVRNAHAPYLRSRLELSRDGGVLGVATALSSPDPETPCVASGEAVDVAGIDGSLRLLSLPDLAQLAVWPHTTGTYPLLEEFSLSAGGRHVARVVAHEAGSRTVQVSDLDGNVTLSLSAENDDVPRLSPDGSGVAVPLFVPGEAKDRCHRAYRTQLYDDGMLVATIPGFPLAWLDDDRLLVNGDLERDTTIYDSSGEPRPGPALPVFRDGSHVRYQDGSPPQLHVPQQPSAIHSLVSGEKLWSCNADTTLTSTRYLLRKTKTQVVLERLRE